MLVGEFLNFLLDDALEEARLRTASPSDAMGFKAAEVALAECRDAMLATDREMPEKLGRLLREARLDAEASSAAGSSDHWFWFCREAQIEWIAEVVSVVLMQGRLPTIVPPTKGAAIAAAVILGVLPG